MASQLDLFPYASMEESMSLEKLTNLLHPCNSQCINITTFLPSLLESLESSKSFLLGLQIAGSPESEYKKKKKCWYKIYELMSQTESELLAFCSSEWNELSSYESTYFCKHTFAALSVLYIDEDFIRMDNHDKNIMLWALLFHDIAKKGNPAIQGRDPFHPFTSTSKAMQIFDRLGWIKRNKLVSELAEFIDGAYVVINQSKCMDNTKISEILVKLFVITGMIYDIDESFENYIEIEMKHARSDRFLYEILALILFHQSLDINTLFPNPIYLQNQEILTHLSPRMVFMLYVLHKADHNSYNVAIPINDWVNNALIKGKVTDILGLFKI